MASYEVQPDRRSLHGKFSRDHDPILTVEDGDTVRFRTLDAGWLMDAPREEFSETPMFEPRNDGDAGHALCGPIAIEGAKPGMTLEVHIGDIRPGAWGFTFAHVRESGAEPEGRAYHRWTLDPTTMSGRNQHGHVVALSPFMGAMGMPPDEPGMLSTGPPRATGGNLDCKELVAGSTLYLPIAVDGGLFSVGDGHAAQGDGEASGTAIECPMDSVDLTFRLRDDLPIEAPRARTSEGWLAFGLDEDLNAATDMAIRGVLDLMQEQYGIARAEALALVSVLVDLRITQIVNGVRGVHAVLPHGALAIPTA
jgi:acetamidase/formamidase